MSQQNVEIVRESLQALEDGGVDAYVAFLDPGINWRAMEGAPDDVGEMTGERAVRRYVQDWFDMFDDFSVTADELVDLGDEHVLAVQRASGRAKLSGLETELRYAVVYALRDGLILRVREYVDRERALEAVGMEG